MTEKCFLAAEEQESCFNATILCHVHGKTPFVSYGAVYDFSELQP